MVLRSKPAGFCVALVLCAVPAGAVELPDATYRALPCRPTIACTADVVPPGVFEIETGYLFRSLGGGTLQHSTPTLLKLTLEHWVQLQVGTNGYVLATGGAPASYLDDVIAGVKFHLVDQGSVAPSVSVSGAVSLPTWAGQSGYLRTTDVLLTGYVTRDIGWLHADLNVGLNLWWLDGPSLPQPWAALALSGAVTDAVGVMVEGYVFGDAVPVATQDAGVLAAVALSPRPWLTFDVGGDVGLYPTLRGFSLFAGLTVIPVDLWDTDRETRVREAERIRLRDIRGR